MRQFGRIRRIRQIVKIATIAFGIALIALIHTQFDHTLNKVPIFNGQRKSTARFMLENVNKNGNISALSDVSSDICSGLADHFGYKTSCQFLISNPQCSSDGLFDYLNFYYCDCKESAFGAIVLVIWLVALFYLLGNTAADYFCLSLQKLSSLLKLSPTVAGVTLLPLGNGAPDVFASIASFMGSNKGEVGLNSVLGGAVFVTCVVVGIVAICVSGQPVKIDKRAFVRDVGFFIFTLSCLLVILCVGKVGVFGAGAFVGIYLVYAVFVAANEVLKKHVQRMKGFTPLIPLGVKIDTVESSLLDVENEVDGYEKDEKDENRGSLPEWMWASNVAIYSNQKIMEHERHLWGWHDDGIEVDQPWMVNFWKICAVLDFPLTLPRRLTIPLVEEETWSKPYAVASASLSPILLAFIFNTQEGLGAKTMTVVYVSSVVIGIALGTLAYLQTVSDHPPRRYLFPWVLGGFVMSIVWFYLIANELVGLLVAFGVFLHVNPSILGLTVLAWGNSMGDLVSNIALALDGGDGIQIALSGCYAGPMFNTLMGLGVSLLIGSWEEKPEWYDVPRDNSVYYTMGFLVTGLVWALVMLLRNDMRVNKVMGVGLVGLYLVFLFVRLSNAMGIVPLVGL